MSALPAAVEVDQPHATDQLLMGTNTLSGVPCGIVGNQVVSPVLISHKSQPAG